MPGSAASRALADLEARAQALAALQAKIGHGKDVDDWLAGGARDAPRLWQALDIENGWEDALEAVLRERLNAIELASSTPPARGRRGDAAPRCASRSTRAPARHGPPARGDACSPRSGRSGRRSRGCSPTGCTACAAASRSARRSPTATRSAWARRSSRRRATSSRRRASRSSRPTASCTACSRASASSRRSAAMPEARSWRRASARHSMRVEAELKERQQDYHAESLALASQQRRVHDLELELMQLRQAAEAAEKRRAQMTQERADVDAQLAAERRQRETASREIADLQSRCTTSSPRATPRGPRATKPRSRARAAASGCAWPSARRRKRASPSAACRDRLAELERRARRWRGHRPAAGAARAAHERARSDRLDAGRGSAAAAARRARRGRAGAGRGARPAGSARRRAARRRRGAARRRAEARARAREDPGDAAEGAGGGARRGAVRRAARRGARRPRRAARRAEGLGQPSQLPGEIERLHAAIAELGAVNLAALDELARRTSARTTSTARRPT